jgi:hypothetical protein
VEYGIQWAGHGNECADVVPNQGEGGMSLQLRQVGSRTGDHVVHPDHSERIPYEAVT